MLMAKAREVIRCCQSLAECSTEPGFTTRPFLSDPMREVHARLTAWMERVGMTVRVDPVGNLRGVYAATSSSHGTRNPAPATFRGAAPRLYIGSHLDTVPRAGRFDGVLGVTIAVALVDLLDGRHLPFAIEVVGFSEEEGVRFGVPFIGSRALVGLVDDELLGRQDAKGRRIREAIGDYGLDPARISEARAVEHALGFLEFHIEQGPVLDRLGLPLGIVDGIVGQSRLDVVFGGDANHAGTTPMSMRRDALAGAAEWIAAVEREARTTPGLVATVGRLDARPGAANVIAGQCRASLDVRHAEDDVRTATLTRLLGCAKAIASGRGLDVNWETRLDQATVPMHRSLVSLLERAVERSGVPVHRMWSGAGHDAMIMSLRMPAAVLFLRTPGGISHHPGESVVEDDVAAALAVGLRCFEEFAPRAVKASEAALD